MFERTYCRVCEEASHNRFGEINPADERESIKRRSDFIKFYLFPQFERKRKIR
jgi:hypothetical protein